MPLLVSFFCWPVTFMRFCFSRHCIRGRIKGPGSDGAKTIPLLCMTATIPIMHNVQVKYAHCAHHSTEVALRAAASSFEILAMAPSCIKM